MWGSVTGDIKVIYLDWWTVVSYFMEVLDVRDDSYYVYTYTDTHIIPITNIHLVASDSRLDLIFIIYNYSTFGDLVLNKT